MLIISIPINLAQFLIELFSIERQAFIFLQVACNIFWINSLKLSNFDCFYNWWRFRPSWHSISQPLFIALLVDTQLTEHGKDSLSCRPPSGRSFTITTKFTCTDTFQFRSNEDIAR